MSKRAVSFPSGVWVALIVVCVLIVVGLLWLYQERSSRLATEAIRREVEEESYREGELGHLPGQVPVRTAR